MDRRFSVPAPRARATSRLASRNLPIARPRQRHGWRRARPRLEILEDRRFLAADLLDRGNEVDSILAWNEILLEVNAADHGLTQPEQGGPLLTSRAMAMVSAAMYDALNSVTPIGEEYLVRAPRAAGANVDAAVAQAAHDVLVVLYPSQADYLEEALAQSLEKIPDGPSESLGISVGSYVAAALLAVRTEDGAGELHDANYPPIDAPGFHSPDPLHPAQEFYGAGADAVEPFAVADVGLFAPRALDDGTPAGRLAFLQSAEYTAAYQEVLALGGDGDETPSERTEEQTQIGLFWAYDGRPGLGTPPRLYNQIARTIAIQERNTEAENARLFALVNLAMADAGLASWHAKYATAFWRPVLGIRGGDTDGNPATTGDLEWTPLGAPASNPAIGESNFTPAFPAYTSGHAAFGSAAFQILTRFYGRDDVSFRFVSDELNGVTLDVHGDPRPLVERTFTSLSAAKWENAQSRIYLGIHWAFDRDEGITQGDAVANAVYDTILEPDARKSRHHHHNRLDPEDVNDDGQCTPMDALIVINELNAEPAARSGNFVDVNGDGQRTPIDVLVVVNRLNGPRGASSAAGETSLRGPVVAPTPAEPEYRALDGTGNNRQHPDWGSAGEQFLRRAAADYADGIAAPSGMDRPGAREISNSLADHTSEAVPNDRDLTAYIYVWGQFLDHDLDLTDSSVPAETLPIAVPAGDPQFDPTHTGTQAIPFTRSAADPNSGTSTANPRQQVNSLSAWIDGGMVYGSDPTRAAALRTFSGGQMKVLESSHGDLPPLNASGLPNATLPGPVSDDQYFLTGDVRGNENLELTSLHTLFLREHNRLARQFAAEHPHWSDETLYQQARTVVIAELQAVTYNEWLPALLGRNALPTYRGYQSQVNPGITNEFATAAFRLHSTINDDVEFFDNQGRPLTFEYVNAQGQTLFVDGQVSLADAFFNPTLFRQTGVEGILKYAASTHAEEIDNQLVGSLRNFLFGAPGQGGLDLASLNIQRGRDHGLADYNTTRAAYGLPRVTSFAQITADVAVQESLQELYGSVDEIDLWVGGLAEDHVSGSSVGPLFRRILADQFQRLRDGDRFWYQRMFSGRQLAQIENTSLGDIIERNTGVRGLQDNVFVFRAEVSGQVFLDRNGNGTPNRGEPGLPRVTLELVDDAGEILASTQSQADGRYRFTQFPETGDYAVRIAAANASATGAPSRSFLISAGDVRVRGQNFALSAAPTNLSRAAEVATISTAVADDAWEENDTLAMAANLGTIQAPRTITDLALVDAGDWYRFTTITTGSAASSASLQFVHAQGDLDLRLYNSRGTLLRTSQSVTDTERVSLANLSPGTYYLRVYGYRGALNPQYALTVQTGNGVAEDVYEQNDTQATAFNLGTLTSTRSVAGLVLADAADWFQFTTTATGVSGSAVRASFQHSQGDLSLELYNSANQRIGIANGQGNEESISLAGLAAGVYAIRVAGVNGAINPSYSLTITPPTPDTAPPPTAGAFNIELAYTGLTTSQQAIFEQAAATWEEVIVGDLPNATFNGQVVDDLLIHASAVAIDGAGNILGQASPDRFRSGTLLPYHGFMEFDSADLAAMQANGTLLGVIMHEMGHVLGIGTIWSNRGLVTGASTNNPLFIGPQALAAYRTVAGNSVSGVPLENTGDAGTRNAHWRESVFGNELMTGYVGPGTNMPLSAITVGSLADLGYRVDPTAADPYTLPSSTVRAVLPDPGGSPASPSTPRLARLTSWWDESAEPWDAAVDAFFATHSPEEPVSDFG